jgi:hypothetical protein
MPSTVFAGLVKFFRDERHLDELIGGLLYCNTPEHYRMSAAEGIGDQHEACMRSYRQSRGDGAMRVTIDGEEIDEITAVTVHRGGKSDMWLHC